MLPPWQVKLERATEQLSQYETIVSEYMSDNPAQISQQLVLENMIEVYLHIYKEPPLILASLVGEIIHNLRSALDSITFEIVLKAAENRKIVMPDWCIRKIQFPIETERDSLSRYCFLDGLEEEAFYADLKELQPFNWSKEFIAEEDKLRMNNGHPLALLRELSNKDKHRGINLVFCKLQDFYISLPVDVKTLGGLTYERNFVNGRRIFYFKIEGVGDYSLVNVVPKFGLSFRHSEYGFPNDSAGNQLRVILNRVESDVMSLAWHIT